MAVGKSRRSVLAAFAVFVSVAIDGASGIDNGNGLVPVLGWSTWTSFGCGKWGEKDVKEVAQKMIDTGLKEAGYDHIILDACWHDITREDEDKDEDQKFIREAKGKNLIPDPKRFPSGFTVLIEHLHELGFKVGLYRNRHNDFSHEISDAGWLVRWKIDYLKHDGYPHNNEAIAKPGSLAKVKWVASCPFHSSSSIGSLERFKDKILSIEGPNNHSIHLMNKFDHKIFPQLGGGFDVSHTVRVGRDTRPEWDDIVRMADHSQLHLHMARPGAYYDLDTLWAGVTDWKDHQAPKKACLPGLTFEQQRTQFGLWAMAASPLWMGHDPRTMTVEVQDMLTLPGVLAISQDKLGIAARRIRVEPSGRVETWARPLFDGTFAVMLWDRGPEFGTLADPYEKLCEYAKTPNDPPAAWFELLGFRGGATVRDVWQVGRNKTAAWLAEDRDGYVMKSHLETHGNALLKIIPKDDTTWANSTHHWECPIWGCEVHNIIHKAAKERWARGLERKAKKEQKDGVEGWLKNKDLMNYALKVAELGITTVSELRVQSIAGCLKLTQKLEKNKKKHGKVYTALMSLHDKK